MHAGRQLISCPKTPRPRSDDQLRQRRRRSSHDFDIVDDSARDFPARSCTRCNARQKRRRLHLSTSFVVTTLGSHYAANFARRPNATWMLPPRLSWAQMIVRSPFCTSQGCWIIQTHLEVREGFRPGICWSSTLNGWCPADGPEHHHSTAFVLHSDHRAPRGGISRLPRPRDSIATTSCMMSGGEPCCPHALRSMLAVGTATAMQTACPVLVRFCPFISATRHAHNVLRH